MCSHGFLLRGKPFSGRTTWLSRSLPLFFLLEASLEPTPSPSLKQVCLTLTCITRPMIPFVTTVALNTSLSFSDRLSTRDAIIVADRFHFWLVVCVVGNVSRLVINDRMHVNFFSTFYTVIMLIIGSLIKSIGKETQSLAPTFARPVCGKSFRSSSVERERLQRRLERAMRVNMRVTQLLTADCFKGSAVYQCYLKWVLRLKRETRNARKLSARQKKTSLKVFT